MVKKTKRYKDKLTSRIITCQYARKLFGIPTENKETCLHTYLYLQNKDIRIKIELRASNYVQDISTAGFGDGGGKEMSGHTRRGSLVKELLVFNQQTVRRACQTSVEQLKMMSHSRHVGTDSELLPR
jgi:hypothetical protein